MLYTMQQAAKKLDRSISTIKRWEREKKISLANRDASTGYRIYTDEDIKIIRRKMRIGEIISPPKQPIKPRKK